MPCNEPPTHITAERCSNAIADDLRCRRCDDSGWRCRSRCAASEIYCSRHHILETPCRSISEPRRKKKQKSNSEKKNTSMKTPKKTATISNILDRAATASSPTPPQPPLPEVVRTVELNQIWAVPHVSDGLPRAYARVDRIHPTVGMVELTPLELHPTSPYESLFAAAKLPVSVGTYSLSPSRSVKPLFCLTNLVTPRAIPESHPGNTLFKIFPQQGEVWAVYRQCTEKHRQIYWLVEVVQGFWDGDGEVTALNLTAEADGTLRRRRRCGFELVKKFAEIEMAMFSHRIPAKRFDGDGDIEWKVDWPLLFELDQVSSTTI